jgi:ribosomal protein S27AE
VVNDIDWSNRFKTECSMCGEPNAIIDEMIFQKRHFELEQKRLEERKQFCVECFAKLVDG